MYVDLTIDIPTLNGVMVEKFIAPCSDNESLWHWRNSRDKYHSFNGMPAYIRQEFNKRDYMLIWFQHGQKINSLSISTMKKIDHKII